MWLIGYPVLPINFVPVSHTWISIMPSFQMDSIPLSEINYSEELLNLIKKGKLKKVIEILQDCFLLHSADASGATLLHYAAHYNNARVSQYLLDKGCYVDVEDMARITPLMIAVTRGHQKVVKMLLAAGADLFRVNCDRESALHMFSTEYRMDVDTAKVIHRALRKQCSSTEEMADKLIYAGCHIYRAALMKDASVIEHMIKRGDSVRCAHLMCNLTIHRAVELDDVNTVNVLLKYGAAVNVFDLANANPLYGLYKSNREHSSKKIEILKLLVSQGVSMTSCTVNGIFNACHVLKAGNRTAIHILLQHGLDFNVTDHQTHKTVLHYLVNNANPGVSEELKDYAEKFMLKVNALDAMGQTPLHVATSVGNVQMVKFLLEQGAHTDIQHRINGVSPIYYAFNHKKVPGIQSDFQICGELLLRYNANPQIVGTDRRGEPLTIFDAAFNSYNDCNRIKPVVAHLAILERLGKPITELTWAKINLHESLKQYFHACRQLLTEEIAGRIRLLDILVSDKKKMARYLNNENVVKKLRDKKYKSRIAYYWYYHNLMGERYWQGYNYMVLKNQAATIIRKIFQDRIHETNPIVDEIIDHLDDRSLQQLRNVNKKTN